MEMYTIAITICIYGSFETVTLGTVVRRGSDAIDPNGKGTGPPLRPRLHRSIQLHRHLRQHGVVLIQWEMTARKGGGI